MRVIEERHGFAGALRTSGGLGAISGPPYSEGRGVLETADELAGVGGEGPALGGRDRLARDELLAERIDEAPVLRDAIVEVGARREPGGADVADHLALRDAPAGADARAEAREVVVHRLVARAVPERHRDAVAAGPARGADAAVRDRAHRRARRRAVVDGEVRAHAAEDRMRARPGEAGGDAGELERRFQEALAERAAGGVVERPAAVGGALEADAGQHAAVAHVLGDEDASVVDERVVGEARLDEQAEARSEEHTSELQSQSNLVCRLLLEKKKTFLTHCSVQLLRDKS